MKFYIPIVTFISAFCLCTNANPLSAPCNEADMLSPMTILHKDIEKMQDSETNGQLMMEQIQKTIDSIPNHMDEIKKICGEEKVEPIEKLTKFMTKMQMINDIMSAVDFGDMEKAKSMIETINCEHMIQYIVRKYATDAEKIEKVMELIKMMDDMKMINEMNESIIYILDDTNIKITKKLVPMMKEQIMANKDKVDENIMMAAKLNMKEVVKKTIEYCYDGLLAMHEIDPEMAHQAMYEAIFQMYSDSIYSKAYKMVMDAPEIHMKRIGMQAMYDKLIAMERLNSLSASKLLFLAEEMMKNEEMISNDQQLKDLLTKIINNCTIFTKNAADGYSCQSVEHIRASMEDKEIQNKEHNEYYIFYNSENPDILNGKFKENPEGDMMMVTVDKQYDDKNVQYKILMKAGDYPEDFHMKGQIVSKKILSKEATTEEELCAMNPKPQANICTPLRTMFMYTIEKAHENRVQIYEKFMEHVKACHKD